jgi:nucleotide-binding universal stress UspA family protein
VAGILVGQSPILTEHIEGEIRGFVFAFFSPVFFAVAGLGMDLRSFGEPTLLGFTLAIILVATIGKFLGAFAGGRLGGLSGRESVALATGLNARGSTEVIVASIGLSMGVLSNQLYTMIVAMAIITTLAMPSTLRWMLARVPMGDDEARRIEKEDAEESEAVPKMERALVYLDDSSNAALAARLAGAFAASQQVVTTVFQMSMVEQAGLALKTLGLSNVMHAARAVAEHEQVQGGDAAAKPRMKLDELVQAKSTSIADAIEREAVKGYSIAFAGVGQPLPEATQRFDPELANLMHAFDGPVAIALNGSGFYLEPGAPLSILVPTGGTAQARLATEIAVALAKATNGTVTVLHVFAADGETEFLRGRTRRLGLSVLVEARRLGKRSGVRVDVMTSVSSHPETAIRRVVLAGRYDLVVLGASLRLSDKKFLGPANQALVQAIRNPTLLVVQ